MIRVREVRVETRILKAEPRLGIAFGYALVSEVDGVPYVDLHGHEVSDSEILKAFDRAIESGIDGKVMHEGQPAAKVAVFPLTKAIAEALGIIGERYGLLIAFKPSDPALLERIAAGEFAGFSIGATATEMEAAA